MERQTCKNMVLDSECKNTIGLNLQTPDNSVSYSEAAVSITVPQLTEKVGVCRHPVDRTFLNKCPPWLRRKRVGHSILNGSSTVSTRAVPYSSGGTLYSSTPGIDDCDLYTSCGFVIGGSTLFDSSQGGNSSVCSRSDESTPENESRLRKFRNEEVLDDIESQTKRAKLESTSQENLQINYRDWQSFITAFKKLDLMSLSDHNVIVCGSLGSEIPGSEIFGSQPKLTKYNSKTGQIVGSVWSEFMSMPDGMVVFTTTTGEDRLALSYGERNAIDFYDAKDFGKRLRTHSIAPDRPGCLCICTSSPGMLVYHDCREEGEFVKWLDCSSYPPIRDSTLTKIQPRCYVLQDMCCVACKEKQLLVTAHYGGVQAYRVGTDQLEWSLTLGATQPGMNKDINAVSVTTNGRGQLLVCDISNNCILILSTDGTVLGTVLKTGDHGLGDPLGIRCCRKTKSVVVAHKKESLCSISILKF